MNSDAVGILLGALGGAAIGLERQRSGHATGPTSHFAGFRTFTLLGGLAAAAGWLWKTGFPWLALVVAAGAVAMVVVAYAAVSRRDPDATTEVAALVVIVAGVLAGLGWWGLSSGIVVVTALLLVEKSRLHAMAERIPDAGLRAGLRFALMAVVILPLLPEGPYGPLGGIRPRELWMLVLFFSGISYGAYVVRSFLGPSQGYVWAGVLGGLISSTNVTLTFSRLSRSEEPARTPLALGVIAACTMLYFRVVVAAAVLNPVFGLALAPYAAGPAIVGAAFIWYGLKRSKPAEVSPAGPANPLEIRSALQMALLFQAMLFLVTAVQNAWGQAGLLVSGAVLGLTDMDALVISMAKVSGSVDQSKTAAAAAVVGIISNTVVKFGLAAAIGQGRYRKLAMGGLLALGVATAVPLAVL